MKAIEETANDDDTTAAITYFFDRFEEEVGDINAIEADDEAAVYSQCRSFVEALLTDYPNHFEQELQEGAAVLVPAKMRACAYYLNRFCELADNEGQGFTAAIHIILNE